MAIRIFVDISPWKEKYVSSLVLKPDNWNDFGYKSLFHMVFYDSDGESIEIGDIKIYCDKSLDKRTYSELGREITELSSDFYSLGQDLSFYDNLKKHLPEQFQSVLNRLNDVATNDILKTIFLNNDRAKDSLLRFSSAENALYKAFGHLYDRDYTRAKIQPFQNNNELMFAKPYLDDGWFDELIANLPNDLLHPLIEQLESEIFNYEILNLIEFTSRAITEIPYFPFRINFSLVNNAVARLDNIFNEEYDDKNPDVYRYKPYYYEFSGYCDDLKGFLELLRRLSDEKYSGYFACRLYYPEDENKYQRHGDEGIIAVLTGNVLFSSSPIESKSGKLIILNSYASDPLFANVLDDEIYKCDKVPYREVDSSKLSSEIDGALFPLCTPEIVHIYNVGQGNCVSIKLDNGKEIFFDIGMTTDALERKGKEIRDAISIFNQIEPDVVVLSHWDLDHILGVGYANDKILDAKWIVPDLWGLMRYCSSKKGILKFPYISDSAKRLLKYLVWKNNSKVAIIDESWSNKEIYKSTNDKIKIFSGKRVSASGYNGANKPYVITPANNFGLIMTLENNNSILLSGDCEYKKMPKNHMRTEYNYLLVPHHCSKMSEPFLIKTATNEDAILCYGYNNSYGHPDRQHMKELDRKGFRICPIVGKEEISINL